MAGALRSFGWALRSSSMSQIRNSSQHKGTHGVILPGKTSDLSGTTIYKNTRGLTTFEEFKLPYKQQLATYLRKRWSSLSHENRSMMKQSFINLTVPAVYSGVIWLVSAGVDMVKETLLNKDTLDDDTTTVPAEVESSKKKLDQKLGQLIKTLEKVNQERESLKSEISRLKGELLERDEENKMLRELLAGNVGQMGIVYMNCFTKNLNNACLLSYYDPPESISLVYWNQN